MEWLILVLILIATYNATKTMLGGKLRWSVMVYWMLVGAYWLYKEVR